MIRDMKGTDLPELVSNLPSWLKGHPAYAGYTIDMDHTRRYVQALWDADVLYGLVLEQEDELVGCFAFTLGAPMFSPDLEATELVFFIEERARGVQAFKLLKQAKQYAEELGARALYIGAKSGHRTETLQKLYIRAGFTPTGGEYCWTKE